MPTKTSAKTPAAGDVFTGQRIRVARLEQGISQSAIANKLGVTFQQVQKYEKGINRVGAARLQTIANFLGKPVSYFFEQPGDQEHSPTLSYRFLATGGGVKLARAFLELPPALQKSLVEHAEVMAREVWRLGLDASKAPTRLKRVA